MTKVDSVMMVVHALMCVLFGSAVVFYYNDSADACMIVAALEFGSIMIFMPTEFLRSGYGNIRAMVRICLVIIQVFLAIKMTMIYNFVSLLGNDVFIDMMIGRYESLIAILTLAALALCKIGEIIVVYFGRMKD